MAQPGASSAGTTRTVPRDEPPEREPPRSSRRDRDDSDDDYDDRPSSRVRKRRRREFEPHRGGLILALGIISFFFAAPVLGPIAWIMGNNDLAAIRAGRMDPEGESQTNTGRICGMVSTILAGVGLVIGLIVFAVWICCLIGLLGSASTNPGGPGQPKRW
jgi:hypothetical protein